MLWLSQGAEAYQVIVLLTFSIWSQCSNLWHWGIHTCLMSYSRNALRRKEVLTHWLPVPSSGALWEGGRISVQYLQWPFPLAGQGPMGKTGEDKQWTIGFRDEQWCQRSMCHCRMWITEGWGVTARIKEPAVSLRCPPGTPAQWACAI